MEKMSFDTFWQAANAALASRLLPEMHYGEARDAFAHMNEKIRVAEAKAFRIALVEAGTR